jgi:hypothetical protein
MFADFEFYTDYYCGNLLNENNFNKFCLQASLDIEKTTVNRVSDADVNELPEPLKTRIKYCACELAEFFFTVAKMQNFAANAGNNEGEGLIKSKTAGAVSVTYDDSATRSYLDFRENSKRKEKIYKQYLFPQCGLNLLSKVVNRV